MRMLVRARVRISEDAPVRRGEVRRCRCRCRCGAGAFAAVAQVPRPPGRDPNPKQGVPEEARVRRARGAHS